MKEILIQELQKEVDKRDRVVAELAKVVHLRKLECVEALLEHAEKIHNRIRMLRIAID
jgi:hypothetical protein